MTALIGLSNGEWRRRPDRYGFDEARSFEKIYTERLRRCANKLLRFDKKAKEHYKHHQPSLRACARASRMRPLSICAHDDLARIRNSLRVHVVFDRKTSAWRADPPRGIRKTTSFAPWNHQLPERIKPIAHGGVIYHSRKGQDGIIAYFEAVVTSKSRHLRSRSRSQRGDQV